MADLTDLEITKACAEAIGLAGYSPNGGALSKGSYAAGTIMVYDPLHDRAQAFELVERFDLVTEPDGSCPECDYWAATWINRSRTKGQRTVAVRKEITLQRAICLCVAKMWIARNG